MKGFMKLFLVFSMCSLGVEGGLSPGDLGCEGLGVLGDDELCSCLWHQGGCPHPKRDTGGRRRWYYVEGDATRPEKRCVDWRPRLDAEHSGVCLGKKVIVAPVSAIASSLPMPEPQPTVGAGALRTDVGESVGWLFRNLMKGVRGFVFDTVLLYLTICYVTGWVAGWIAGWVSRPFALMTIQTIIVQTYYFLYYMFQKEKKTNNDAYVFDERMNILECSVETSLEEMKGYVTDNLPQKEYVTYGSLAREITKLNDKLSIIQNDFEEYKKKQIKYNNQLEGDINRGIVWAAAGGRGDDGSRSGNVRHLTKTAHWSEYKVENDIML